MRVSLLSTTGMARIMDRLEGLQGKQDNHKTISMPTETTAFLMVCINVDALVYPDY